MTVLGIDEVGRGCWAGPLVAGAVVLPDGYVHASDVGWRLSDSKVLSRKQREVADSAIRERALAVGLGWVSSAEIDFMGLTVAVGLAMRRAVDEANIKADTIIIDGSINYLLDMPQTKAVIKADGSILAVSAASIVAKVARDRYMAEAAMQYPGYGFEKHVGYGTTQHRKALLTLGLCPLHRRSFKPIAKLC